MKRLGYRVFRQTRPENSLKNFSDEVVGIDFKDANNVIDILNMGKIDQISHFINVAGLMKKKELVSVIHNVNCISPFALMLLLLPSLLSKPQSSITFVSSSSHIRAPPYVKGDIQKYLATSTAGYYPSIKAVYFVYIK